MLARGVHSLRSLLLRQRQIDEIKINQGRMLTELQRGSRRHSLHEYGFKVFSQWDEDGIIQFLVRHVSIANRSFIEFGVEDFSEANCRFLLMKDHWAGFVIDGSEKNIASLRNAYFYWQHPLQGKAAFVTCENASSLLEESGFDKELGILSIDIDGVDYHVLGALGAWRPAILIVEYNAVFGRQRAVSVPYSPGFQRTRAHHSNLYYGASLPAFVHVAAQRGYSLVGVNSVGSNAFFVRNDLLNDEVRASTLASCYRDSSFRESRGSDGGLTCLSGSARRGPIAALPLIDVVSGASLTVGDLTD